MTQEAALSTEVWKEHNLNGADSEGGRQNGGDAEASINDIKHSPPAQHVIVPDPPGTRFLCIHHRLSPIICLLRTVAGAPPLLPLFRHPRNLSASPGSHCLFKPLCAPDLD